MFHVCISLFPQNCFASSFANSKHATSRYRSIKIATYPDSQLQRVSSETITLFFHIKAFRASATAPGGAICKSIHATVTRKGGSNMKEYKLQGHWKPARLGTNRRKGFADSCSGARESPVGLLIRRRAPTGSAGN